MDKRIDSASIRKRISDAEMLVDRLERLSADSIWAHQASGVRGSLLKFLERLSDQDLAVKREDMITVSDISNLDTLIKDAFTILENAAREIPEQKEF